MITKLAESNMKKESKDAVDDALAKEKKEDLGEDAVTKALPKTLHKYVPNKSDDLED